MKGPALAVIGSDGQLERSTAAFSSLGATDALLDDGSGELERVLRGEAASAVLSAGGMTAAVEAVVDASGGRHALLTLSGAAAEEASGSGSANPLLDEDLDASPAIIFLKDLDGCYLRVNAMHGQVIGGGEAQLLGNTDDKLAPRLTVDGPRLAGRDESVPEPPQLEYIVPAFESRPALSVLRFLVHDGEGNPVALCGVASPMAQAGVAQAEAERLMSIERLAHLDPSAARAELLSQWGLLGGANAEAAAIDRTSVLIPDGLVARAAEGDDDTLSRLLAEERLRGQELEQALAQAEMALAAASASVAGQESEDARLYAEQARVQSEQAQAEAEHLRSELDLAVAEVEQARAAARREHEDAEAAKAVAQSARGEAGQALLRIEQLQTEAAALSSRLEQAEADARDWRVRAEHTEVEAVQARARAEQAEADARTARSRVEEEGSATRQAESRVEQAESAARVAKSRAEQAETEARQARATAEQAETDVRKARTRAEQAEADARLALARAEHAEAEARQAQLRADEAESAARQAMGRTEQTEALLLETRSRLEKAESEARQARARQEESDTALAGWRTRAEQAETELRLARERPIAPAANDSDASGELREAIAAERARTDELRRTLSEAQTRLSEMAGELEASRARQALEVEQLRAELSAQSARAAAQLEDLRVTEEARREEIAATQREEMEAARELAETARAQAETAREQAQAASKGRGRGGERASDPEAAGLRWSPAGQRELATALGDVDELRSGFVRASSVLGARGGWDLVAVWMPDPRGLLRCVASWAREPLRELEQLALRTAEPVQKSDLGAALYAREPVCVMSAAADGGRAPESRLARAFAGGAQTALLLPIRDGVARIGVLEFLSQGDEAPSDDVVLALEAVGLQLGQFAALTRARQHRR